MGTGRSERGADTDPHDARDRAADSTIDPSVDPAEFEDLTASEPVSWQGVDWAILRQPQVVQALIALVASTIVLIRPDEADRTAATIIALAVWSSSLVMLAAAASRRSWAGAGLAALGLLAATFVLVARRDADEALALLVGAGTALVGSARLIDAARRRDRGSLAGALVPLALGLVTVAFPSAVFRLALVAVAAGAGLFAVVALAASLDPSFDGVATLRRSQGLVRTWLAARHRTADDRQALYDKILFEGPLVRRRLIRFGVLMTFAAIIASMGVITDSTAVVIGAMLIAPLMTPLMGTSISLIMGWPARLQRSALVAAGGIGLAIVVGLVLGLMVPAEIDTVTNSQVASRATPTMLDLITALAAGAAGAYGLSRPDVSDALPGVAIAISLVPPLTVVGIAYGQGDLRSGNGALLLFATNMLAILVMGGVTFVLTGITPLARLSDQQHRLRTWSGTVTVVAAAVIGALRLNGAEIARNTFEQGRIETVAAEWLAPAPTFSVVEVGIEGDTVTVVVIGPGNGRPAAQPLADRLSTELGREVTAVVRHVVEQRETATGSG